MKKVLLIDGDQFLFVACAAIEKEIRWDDQNHVLYSNRLEARNNFDGMMGRIFDRFDTKDHVLTFSKGVNFRLGIDSTYKAHRVGDRKPLCYAELRTEVEADYRCVAYDTLEADDVMGILATKPGRHKSIIVSQDKDMQTLPATIWNGQDLLTQSKREADAFHLYQTLIGDTADGYKGCPAIGPVKAKKILDVDLPMTPEGIATTPEQYNALLWKAVVAAYEKAELTEADALVQARLARILRWSDWDAEKKEPILWTPAT